MNDKDLNKATAALNARKALRIAEAKEFLETLTPEQKAAWAELQAAERKLTVATRTIASAVGMTGVVQCREAQDKLNKAKDKWNAVFQKAVAP